MSEKLVEETKNFATWADLCQPPPPKEVQLPSGKWIKYLPWLDTEQMSEIQRKATIGKGQGMNFKEFVVLVISQVMITPPLSDAKDARRLILKANSSIMTGILNDVVDTDTFSKIKADLGEDLQGL